MATTTTLIVLLAAALFFIGITIGWVITSSVNEDSTSIGKLRIVVGLAVTIVWIAATLADILITAYTISPLIHALMGAIVGFLFTEDGLDLNFDRGNE